MDSGIYCIFNKSNGKIYVGQSVQLKTRISQHKSELNFNNHSNKHLQSAWNKYGEDAFDFIIVEICDEEKLNDHEIWWINYFNSTNPDNGYNLESGGNSNYHLSDETKQKISENRKGKCLGEDNPFYGKTHTLEVRKKISENQLGRKHSDETKNKMSKAHIGLNSGEKHYNYGKPLSLDVKTKISENKNASGYFRVHILKNKKCKHGFSYAYKYYDDGERKAISRVNIDKLEEDVLSEGLEWRVLDNEVSIIDKNGGLDNINSLIKKGLTMEEIAIEFNISVSGLENYLHARHTSFSKIKFKEEKISTPAQQKIIDAGGLDFISSKIIEGWTMKQVAKNVGVNVETVRLFLKNNDLTWDDLVKKNIKSQYEIAGGTEYVIKRAELGVSFYKIAEEMGITYDGLRYHLRKQGLKMSDIKK